MTLFWVYCAQVHTTCFHTQGLNATLPAKTEEIFQTQLIQVTYASMSRCCKHSTYGHHVEFADGRLTPQFRRLLTPVPHHRRLMARAGQRLFERGQVRDIPQREARLSALTAVAQLRTLLSGMTTPRDF